MTRLVAHVIVGAKPEPFLPAMLASIAPAVERVFVNENSGLGTDAPNLAALESSTPARDGKLVLARTTFESFASARNVCFDLDRDATPDTWIVFIDADEVHGERFTRIAAQLHKVPAGVGYVDAFTWHFFMSFDWYLSIERRMMVHRWTPLARWKGEVHERLEGVSGRRIALPYIYGHYGNVVPFSEHARKGAQYSGLGAEGTPLTQQAAEAADIFGNYDAIESYYTEFWPRLLRFGGAHPVAARMYIEEEKGRRARDFSAVERLIKKHQPLSRRTANALMKVNYEQRWRLRVFNPLAWQLL